MWRSENRPSNSTSCSDNALRLLVLEVGRLYRGLQVTSSFSIWGCVLKGCFERGIFWKGQIAFEGHWRLQFWTWMSTPAKKIYGAKTRFWRVLGRKIVNGRWLGLCIAMFRFRVCPLCVYVMSPTKCNQLNGQDGEVLRLVWRVLLCCYVLLHWSSFKSKVLHVWLGLHA